MRVLVKSGYILFYIGLHVLTDSHWSYSDTLGVHLRSEPYSMNYVFLKHKDSFGKSENLSKIFFAEILVFDHDYEGKSSSSNGLLKISFIFKNYLFELFFELFGGLRTNLYTLSTILCKV